MHVKEGRAIVAAIRHICWKVDAHCHRVLVLSDNLGLVLALSKGRCSDYGQLRLCQRLLALGVACNVRVSVRWVPSELNVADADSRRWERPKDETSRNCRSSGGGEEEAGDGVFQEGEIGEVEWSRVSCAGRELRGHEEAARPDRNKRVRERYEGLRDRARKRHVQRHERRKHKYEYKRMDGCCVRPEAASRCWRGSRRR